MDPLDTVKRRIEAGDREGARRTLFQALRVDPYNVAAWALLATVLDDPDKQADCYRRILALDPGNREVAEKLRQITGGPPQTPPSSETGPLQCPQCGGVMEVRFAESLRDKRAVCPYCGTEVDLPDAYQRIQRQREEARHPWGSRTVEETVIEARSDHPEGLPDLDEAIPESLGEVLRRAAASGGEVAVQSTIVPEDEAGRRTPEPEELAKWMEDQKEMRQEGRKPSGLLGKVLNFLTGETPVATTQGTPPAPPAGESLTLDEIIQAAGGPLPPEERRKCAKCGATISKRATRCTWCGTWFEDGEM
jgi:DNA-directed RNA polymerase subunit M/transcription elongation factor TFIIS